MTLKSLYGLPKKVIFCKKTLISNQRPTSEIEFLHNRNTKKKALFIDKNLAPVIVTPALLAPGIKAKAWKIPTTMISQTFKSSHLLIDWPLWSAKYKIMPGIIITIVTKFWELNQVLTHMEIKY